MPRHFILRMGGFIFSVVLKETDSSDVELIMLTDFHTGDQVCINESDINNVFHDIELNKNN